MKRMIAMSLIAAAALGLTSAPLRRKAKEADPEAVARFNERFGTKPIGKRAKRRARGKSKA